MKVITGAVFLSERLSGAVEAARFAKATERRVVVVSDATVAGLYAGALMRALEDESVKAILITFPAGEEYKTRSTKEMIEDRMLSSGMNRDSLMIALGGGVVMDMAGFVAATFCRGIPLYMIPTTLLGMVDAAHGGKNGVNTPLGKNLVGSYLLPDRVFIDPGYLSSEPLFQTAAGFAEMLKIAAVLRRDLFLVLRNISMGFSKASLQEIAEAIPACVQLKEQIAISDLKDRGVRNLLNFGHTVGHALESALGYSIPHGMAVLIGMIIESRISTKMGVLPKDELALMEDAASKLLDFFPFKPSIPPFAILQKHLLLDKKAVSGSVHMVLLKSIGTSLVSNGRHTHPVELSEIEESLTAYRESESKIGI